MSGSTPSTSARLRPLPNSPGSLALVTRVLTPAVGGSSGNVSLRVSRTTWALPYPRVALA